MIWELTETHPIVDLRVFRHRGFAASVLTISLAFGAFFGANVLTPMWLQSYMGYTATWAGMTTAWSGVLAVLVAPIAAGLSAKVDPRPLVFGGVVWLGIVTLLRVVANTDMDYWQIALPLLLMGLGMPFFFVPLNGLALGSVEESETASAAGLLNFLRTVSGAFATSLVTTLWEDGSAEKHAELAGLIDPQGASAQALAQQGMPADAVRATLDQITQGQAVMVATNDLLSMVGIAFFIAAFAIWLAPRPTRVVDAAAAGH